MDQLLIGFDGSDESNLALRQGLKLAKALNCEVTVAYYVEPVTPAADLYPAMVIQQWTDEHVGFAKKQMVTVDNICKDAGVVAHTSVAIGSPAEGLLQVANSQDAVKMVLVGSSSGRSAVSRFFLGSVANRLVNHCQKPVLIVR